MLPASTSIAISLFLFLSVAWLCKHEGFVVVDPCVPQFIDQSVFPA